MIRGSCLIPRTTLRCGERPLSSIAQAVEPWDLLATVVLLFAIIYAVKLYWTFKGGKLSRPHLFALGAALAMFLTFFVSVLLDAADIVPVTQYGFSFKNLGILVGVILMVLAARDFASFWNLQTTMKR